MAEDGPRDSDVGAAATAILDSAAAARFGRAPTEAPASRPLAVWVPLGRWLGAGSAGSRAPRARRILCPGFVMGG